VYTAIGLGGFFCEFNKFRQNRIMEYVDRIMDVISNNNNNCEKYNNHKLLLPASVVADDENDSKNNFDANHIDG